MPRPPGAAPAQRPLSPGAGPQAEAHDRALSPARSAPARPGIASERGGAGRRATLTGEQRGRIRQMALAACQEAQSTWRKADLIRHLGELLPDDVSRLQAGATPQPAARSRRPGPRWRGRRVLTLEAPEWPRVPDALRRADGRSIYRPHSGTRYATRGAAHHGGAAAAQAQQPGAPRLAPELAALAARRGPGSAGGSAPRRGAGARRRRRRGPASGCAWTRPPRRSSR